MTQRALSALPKTRNTMRIGAIATSAILTCIAGCGGGGVDGALDTRQTQMSSAEDVHEDDGPSSSGPTEGAADALTSVQAREHVLAAAAPMAEFNGGPLAYKLGSFAPVHNWPIIPLHLVQLPDGRVMSYGTKTNGVQGAGFNYVVWDPALGTDAAAFQVLPNFTSTDIFCAGQTLLPSNGQVLIVGGDASVNGVRNYASSDVNLFDPATNTLTKQTQATAYQRWYPTVVVMGNGDQVVVGGRMDKDFAGTTTKPATKATYPVAPEVRTAGGQWKVLSGAPSKIAYGEIGLSWFYPRAWLTSDGKILIIAHNGRTFKLDPAAGASATGAVWELNTRTDPGRHTLPSVMYAPGKILSIRNDRKAVTADLGSTGYPTFSPAGQVSKERHWGSATVLADGKVWVNGGSAQPNILLDEVYESEIWDPKTRKWSAGATAAKYRLYHSASMLLADGTVYTGGGGAPGPATQLNGEIYYPPYLFSPDGSGQLQPRPRITVDPPSQLTWGQGFSVTASSTISRATLVRVGAVTHSFNNDARFFELTVPLAGKSVSLTAPDSANVAPPGYYMLFVWNPWGVPSVAKIVRIS